MKWRISEMAPRNLILASSAMSAVAGACAAYVVSARILEKKFRAIADAEIQEAKVFYQEMYSRPVFVEVTPEEESDEEVSERMQEAFDDLPTEIKERMITQATEALKTYTPDEQRVIQETRRDQSPSPTIVNIFANATPPGEEVLEALMANRNPAEPYIITKVEFFENEPDHEQAQFTFYEGDSVLVDDRDEYSPIQDTEKVAGDDNLLRFGYGSGDEHTLYIRNESIDPPMDLCITRSTGRYTDEVMGFSDDEPHLKHSQPRRFRHTDE